MKKYIALLLVLVMAFSFAACGQAETPSTPDNTPVATPTPDAAPETPAETPEQP